MSAESWKPKVSREGSPLTAYFEEDNISWYNLKE